MLVSISKAAEMVGITRATFYRHVERKGISTTTDDDGNPKVDVSELIRVYGDRVRVTDREEGADNNDTPKLIHPIQGNTPSTAHVEVGVLKERINALELERQLLDKERGRERDQLQEQIDMLRGHLTNSEEQQKRLTLLLTDQRRPEEGREDRDQHLLRQFEELKAIIDRQSLEKQEQEGRIKALEQRIGEIKEKGDSVFKSLKEKNKELATENKELKQKAETGLFKRLFSS